MDYAAFGIGISASALLSTSAAFLLGFYLTTFNLGKKKQAHPFGYLVMILSAMILLINSVLVISIDLTNFDSNTQIIFISTIALFTPPIAFFGLLIFKH